jgi:hypothetical protein
LKAKSPLKNPRTDRDSNDNAIEVPDTGIQDKLEREIGPLISAIWIDRSLLGYSWAQRSLI